MLVLVIPCCYGQRAHNRDGDFLGSRFVQIEQQKERVLPPIRIEAHEIEQHTMRDFYHPQIDKIEKTKKQKNR